MSIRMMGAGLGLVTCAAIIVLAQSQSVGGQTTNIQTSHVLPILTPAQKANIKEVGRLDDAAEAAQKAGDYAEAEDDARKSMSLGPDSGIALEVLAASLEAQGKTQEALKTYKVLSDEGEETPRNELPYALLLLKAGHWAEAVEAYNRQLPGLPEAELMQAHGGFSPAVPRPTELAAAIHIGLGVNLGWRGYHGTYKEASQQAQGQFQQALALEPTSPLANYYVGYGLKRLGRRAEAQAAFRKAAALGQGDVKLAAQKELPEIVQPK